MPDTILYRFDPKKVKFRYKGGKIFSPMQRVKGKGKQYIGDGETITSAGEFNKYNIFHGLKPGTAIAKTVHYLKRGLYTYALKHQSFLAEPGLEILDSKTEEVLYRVSNQGNIYLGEAHPDYKEDETAPNYVGMLATKDEIKIGAETDENGNQSTIFKDTDKLIIPGSAIGFIKYEEGMDKHARHPQQWYGHVVNDNIIKHFEKHYLPKVEESIRKVMRLALDTPQSTSAEKLSKLMQILDKGGDDTRIASFRELIKLGAGYHVQTASIVDSFLYKNLVSDDMM